MGVRVERLVAAAAWGAGLAIVAGCGGNTEAGASADAGRDAAMKDVATDAVVDVASDATDAAPLVPYPDNLGCSGPVYDSGYYGQCCTEALCGQADGGVCPPADSVMYWLPGYPPGSGTCTCGGSATGPFAPRTASEGPCCYVVGSIECDGRPLLVAGRPRLAPVVERADWARI